MYISQWGEQLDYYNKEITVASSHNYLLKSFKAQVFAQIGVTRINDVPIVCRPAGLNQMAVQQGDLQ